MTKSINQNMESSQRKNVPLDKQFLALTHVYMCNTVLCIYKNRNKAQISDVVDEKESHYNVFGFKLPKVQSIVRPLSSKQSHGWLRVDVYLTKPNTVLERWYFIHTPLPQTQTPEMTEKIKYELFHKIKTLIRSLQSITGCMPAETLILSLSRIHQTYSHSENVSTDSMQESQARQIRLELTPLSDFPVVEPSVPNSATLTLKDLITPFGTCTVRCVYNTKLESLLPRTIHVFPPTKEEIASTEGTKQTPEKPVSSDLLSASSEYNSEEILTQSEYQKQEALKKQNSEQEHQYKAPDKLPDALNDSTEALNSLLNSLNASSMASTLQMLGLSFTSMSGSLESQSVDFEEFQQIIDNTKFSYPPKPISVLQEELTLLSQDVDDVLSQWSRSG